MARFYCSPHSIDTSSIEKKIDELVKEYDEEEKTIEGFLNHYCGEDGHPSMRTSAHQFLKNSTIGQKLE